MKSEENGNYTLGKWAVEPGGGKVVVTGLRHGRACIIAAELYDEENEPSLGEIEANARLIAAAPELLEVVKRHLDFCGLKNCPTCKMAEAAITKVESEGRRNKP